MSASIVVQCPKCGVREELHVAMNDGIFPLDGAFVDEDCFSCLYAPLLAAPKGSV